MKLDSPSSTISKQSAYPLEIGSIFWQQWQQYRDCLYRCCIKWMGGNPVDAEDALSWAMLKAWEKVQKYAGEIANFKAWLMTLTRNNNGIRWGKLGENLCEHHLALLLEDPTLSKCAVVVGKRKRERR